MRRAIGTIYRRALAILDRVLPAQRPGRLAAAAGRFWGRSARDPRLRDLSHWRGEGRWAEGAWEALGTRHLAHFERLRALAGVAGPIGAMVEWGPGGGANIVAFAAAIPRCYGVDISRANLAECTRQAAAHGVDFVPVPIAPERPDDCLQTIRAPVGLFLSTAVYQHFPGKAYGVEVTRLAWRMLAAGGVALIQTRYDDDAPALRAQRRGYRRNAVTFTAYGIAEFWAICAAAGFTPLAVALEPEHHYAYYYLKR